MEFKLNYVQTSSGTANLGVPTEKSWDPGIIRGAVAIPKGTIITAANAAAFTDYLQARLILDAKTDRWQRFPRFVELEDQSTDKQEKEYNYGDKVIIRDSVYQFQFLFIEGGFPAYQAVLNMKGRERDFDILFYDHQMSFWGTRAVTTDAEDGMKGFSLNQIYVDNWKPKDGSENHMYAVAFSFADATQFTNSFMHLDTDIDLFALNVVKTLAVDPLTALDGGDVNLGITSLSGAVNYVEKYGSSIVASLFTITEQSTGNAITLTGISVGGVGANAHTVMDIDEADTDYPASTEKLVISSAAPSAWNTAIGEYVEFEDVVLTET